MNDDITFDDVEESPVRMAYIRTVHKSEIAHAPDDAPETLYALHDDEGRPLALFSSRDSAVVTAKTHNFQPVTVH